MPRLTSGTYGKFVAWLEPRSSFIRSFLKDRFGGGPATLSHLCARDVVAFVQDQAPRLHPRRAKLLTNALRSFLQYVRYRGRELAEHMSVYRAIILYGSITA